MSIKVFSPIDGTIGKIEDLQDGIFSNKMLGDGFFIRPDKKADTISYYSPVEKGQIQFVADTKHAFFFNLGNDVNVLMHIGLDTVNLNGEPFSNVIEIEKEVNIDSKIVDVNMKTIHDANLEDACPITINGEKETYEFKLTNTNKQVKKGDLIGEFVLVEKTVNEVKDLNNEETVRSFFQGEDYYTTVAKKVNKLVGTQQNYSEVYNCMTRLRFKIKNKEVVKVDEIKKIGLVKGIVWNGNELQVVIGQDVYKLKEAVSNLNQSEVLDNLTLQAKMNPKNVGIFRRFLATFTGIMVPCIPVFIGGGLVSAITGILMWLNIMPAMSWAGEKAGDIPFSKVEWYWVVMFAISKSATMFVGITIAVSASKFFGLRLTMGCAIGVVMCSPALFLDGGQNGIGGQWDLFTMGHITKGSVDVQYFINKLLTVSITCGNIKIFVIIPTIYLAKKLDDWLLKVINPMFELTFRSFLTFFLTTAIGLALIMPVWNFIESLVSLLFVYIGKIPYGIGVGIYTAAWQIAVTVGLHLALGMVGVVQGLSSAAQGHGGYGIFGAGSSISVYSMMGAMVALMIITKNSNLKNQCKGLLILPILGITEPILYGITMPRKRTFWAAILGSFVAGCALGIFKVTGRLSTGIGIFEAIGFFNYTVYDPTGSVAASQGELTQLLNGIYYLICVGISFGAGFGFSILMSTKRKTEKASIKKGVKDIKNLLKNKLVLSNTDKNTMKDIITKSNETLKEIYEILSKEDIKLIKTVEKDVVKIIQFETKIDKIVKKEISIKDKLNARGKNLVRKNKLESAKALILKIQKIDNTAKIKIYKDELSNIKPNYESVNNLISEKMAAIKKVIEQEAKVTNADFLTDQKVLNNFYNALNEMKLEYKIDERKADYEFGENIALAKYEIKNSKVAQKALA